MSDPSTCIPQSHTRLAHTSSYTESIANLFRLPAALTSLEYTAGPYSTLTVSELDVLLEVILMTMDGFPHLPEEGTIRLAGQYRYTIPEYHMIFGAHLRQGPYDSRRQSPYIGSSQRTLQAIKAAAHAPTDRESAEFGSVFCPLSGLPDSGIYCHGDYRMLILNTTYGRFLASIDTNLRDHHYDDLVLWAITETLACLRPHDTVLQRSIKQITSLRTEADEPLGNCVAQLIHELFDSCQPSHPQYNTDQPGAFRKAATIPYQHPVLRSWRNGVNIDNVLRRPLCYFEQDLSKS